ncbi:multicopper oxidase domain-containing protein, partial [Malonomonas rubra]|uniref:multicopper oxidase domain-containing protein n=1 Tax=Malonomonas rubra TaxID=57040 RepID=UPI0026F27E34
RQLSLNEEESAQVCVTVAPTGAITTVATFPAFNPNIVADCAALGAVPQAPKAALLGAIGPDPLVANNPPLAANPLLWKDPITENPAEGATENWDFYNFTVDGHPIHMHLVRYEIVQRQLFDPLSPTFAPIGAPIAPLPNELGKKDTVLTYPGEITRVKATFDLPGLYVWHCHIVEHEDNEMMRPYYVGVKPAGFPVP